MILSFQYFHSDLFADILGLHCRGVAEEGGEHVISSSYRIYNELISRQPNVIEILSRPDWLFDS